TPKVLTPFVSPLEIVPDSGLSSFSRPDLGRSDGGILVIGDSDRLPINHESEIVVDCLRGRKLKSEIDYLFLVTRVAKTIDAGERDFVSAVPEKTFLTMLEIESNVDPAALQWQSGK